MKPYSIIIPVYNENKTLVRLLTELTFYKNRGHEVVIVNDGSTDNTSQILKKYSFIKLITLKENFGKGTAIKAGLLISKFNRIIIYDGDLELKTKDIAKFMILNKSYNINSVMGYRFDAINFFQLNINWGNFMFTTFFNLLYSSCHKDILCCAKSFYKEDVNCKRLKSTGFDIDVEISTMLTKNNRSSRIKQIKLNYRRRTFQQGKKLNISDGWKILKRIFLTI
jgi:dolichol-phosphate mannosyltransferase